MPLPVDLYFEAIPDLGFTRWTHRVGTCPACGSYGLTLKLLQWPDGRLEYEPFCPNGCIPTVVNEAVWLAVGEPEAQVA